MQRIRVIALRFEVSLELKVILCKISYLRDDFTKLISFYCKIKNKTFI